MSVTEGRCEVFAVLLLGNKLHVTTVPFLQRTGVLFLFPESSVLSWYKMYT